MNPQLTNLLIGIRKWVNDKLESMSYVISSHIVSLTGRMDTAETKLSGIAEGAQANVIETVKVDGTALTPTSKAVDIDLATPLAGKVDKVNGKGLSTNDLTDALKTDYDDAVTKKHEHSNKSVLDGISSTDVTNWNAAEANVINAITVNGTAVTVTNKTAAITISTGSTITVDSSDKVLTLANDVLSSQISLVHDSTNHLIKLLGKGAQGSEELISEFSTEDFIKDGMLDYAGLHVRVTESSTTTWTPALPAGITEPSGTADGTYIVLNWNTGASKSATFINVTSLIDTYTAGTGLTLTGHQFSLNAASASTIGGVKVAAVATSGLVLGNDGSLSVESITPADVVAILEDETNYPYPTV